MMFDMDQPPFICRWKANRHRIGVGGVGECVLRPGRANGRKYFNLGKRPRAAPLSGTLWASKPWYCRKRVKVRLVRSPSPVALAARGARPPVMAGLPGRADAGRI